MTAVITPHPLGGDGKRLHTVIGYSLIFCMFNLGAVGL